MVYPGSPVIAVVVSDPVQRDLVLAHLRHSGRAVVSFETTERAMAGMEASPPGLVIAMLSAPRLEGWALCRRLRSSACEYLHAIPVLILSADMPGAEAVQITTELGGNGLLPYPVDRECLLAEVDRLLNDAALTPTNSGSRIFHAGEKRFRRAAKDAGAGYYFIDPEGCFRWVNAAWLALHGYARLEEVVGQHFSLTQVDSDLEKASEITRRLLAGLPVPPGEFSRKRKDGSIGYHIFTAHRVMDRGQVVGLEGFLIDTTAFHKAEERYQMLFDRMLDACALHEMIFDAEGRPVDYRFLAVNPAFEQMTGLAAREIVGKRMFKVLPGTERHWIETYGRVVATGEPCRFESPHAGLGRTFEVVAFRPAEGQFACIFRDITERKKAEEALQESREFLRVILNSIPVRVFWKDRNLAYLGCNTQFARDAGFEKPEDVIGKDDHAMGWREQAEAYRADDRAVMESGDSRLLFEEPQTTPSGERIHLLSSKLPLRDAGGATVGVLGTYLDISDRKRAEKALRESEETHRALVAGLPDIVMRFDRYGRHLFVSDNVREVVDLQAAQFIGKTHRELGFPAALCQSWEEAIQGVFDSGIPFESEFSLDVKRGAVTFDWRLVPEFDTSGAVKSVLSISRDITDHRRAERALQDSEALNREVVSSVGEGIIVYDSQFRYVVWNKFMEDLTGVPAGDVLGRPALDLFPHLREQGVDKLLEQALAGETVRSPDTPFYVSSTGRTGWVVGTYSPHRDAEGNIVGVVATTLDITSRKRAEEEEERLKAQLMQAQKMESAGRLAGGIAHDFNNLLTVINGYSDLILAGLQTGDPLRDSVGDIRNAGGRAAELTRQLLTFSRKQVIEPRPVNLNALILESRGMLRRILGEDIEMVTDLDPDPGQVMADPGHLHQVLMNLVVNARDAMPAGGRLTLRSSRIHIDETETPSFPGAVPGPYLVMEVSDTGVGMSEEIQQKLFEPFFTTKAVGTGTGLGLSTVYGIVRQAGGWIRVDSRPEMGATFRIGLPLLAESSPQAPPDALPRTRLEGSETVLVVEDQDEVRRLAVAVLKSFRYRTLEARSGGEALVVAENYHGPIHLLLTDVVMPQVTGKQLADRLTVLRSEMKVLYMSGYTADVISRQGVLDSGIECIQKPFTPEALGLNVRKVLGEPQPRGSVLVVDDEESIRKLFTRILTRAGYEVNVAADGDQAEKILGAGSYDLMITDLVMPNREGIETIRAIRQIYPGLKIIAVSGAFGGRFLKTAAMLGADATLTKPVGPDHLVETVRNALTKT